MSEDLYYIYDYNQKAGRWDAKSFISRNEGGAMSEDLYYIYDYNQKAGRKGWFNSNGDELPICNWSGNRQDKNGNVWQELSHEEVYVPMSPQPPGPVTRHLLDSWEDVL